MAYKKHPWPDGPDYKYINVGTLRGLLDTLPADAILMPCWNGNLIVLTSEYDGRHDVYPYCNGYIDIGAEEVSQPEDEAHE